MFIETSDPRRVGEEAHLDMLTNQTPGDKCLTFWVHLYGADIGQLVLNAFTQAAATNSLAIYSGIRTIYLLSTIVDYRLIILATLFTFDLQYPYTSL